MKTLKEKIESEIQNGNLFAWNDGDGGLSEAIDCKNVTATYEKAVEELSNELYKEDWLNKNIGWSKSDAYLHAIKFDTDEMRHTWIYDLKEYLEDLV